MLRQARIELTLGWALDGSGESVAARSMHSASQAMGRLARRLAPAQVLGGVVETLAADFDSALARIWVFDPKENVLHLRSSAGLSRRTTTSSRARIDLSRYRYKVGVVARTREPFVSNSIVGDGDFDQRWVRRERLVSVAILPLAMDGSLQGILASFFRSAVSEDVVGALGIFAATVAAAIAAQRSSVESTRLSA
jgi:GAF domain-containing protein